MALKRVNFNIDEEILEDFDAIVDYLKTSRSGVLKKVMKDYIRENKELLTIYHEDKLKKLRED